MEAFVTVDTLVRTTKDWSFGGKWSVAALPDLSVETNKAADDAFLDAMGGTVDNAAVLRQLGLSEKGLPLRSIW
jgi:hypothetical protein